MSAKPDNAAPLGYREATIAELNSTDPRTPRRLDKSVVVTCKTGVVVQAEIVFADGEQMTNVLRAVIALDPGPNKDGPAMVMITRFNNEIGKIVYEVAKCTLGEFPELDTVVL